MERPHFLKAVIFDVDGTIAETERDGHLIAFNSAFNSLGLGWQWDEGLYAKLLKVTGGKERLAHFITHHSPPMPTGPSREELISAVHAKKTAHYLHLAAEGGMKLRPGVLRLINECRAADIALAIATTTTDENVRTLLAATICADAPKWFQVIASGDIVRNKKPAPDIYLWTLEQLRLKPSECIAIEDSQNGLLASLEAGIPTVITVSSFTGKEQFSGASLVVSDLGEPNYPLTVLAGNMFAKSYVDIELLTRLVDKAAQRPPHAFQN
jgi:HAD superfamily hydrolase (TIGR01509 family)